MKKYLAITGLVTVTIIWGGGFVASDMALESLRPFQIMAIRFLMASVLMGAASIRELKGINFKELQAGILMGTALFVGFAFQIVGLQYTTPSKNAFLTALNVVLVPFISFILLRKKINRKSIAGAAMAIVGVGLLSLEKNMSLSMGDALTLVCAVGFAFQIFFTSEFVKKYRAVVLNFIQMLTAVLLSAACLFLFGETNFHVTHRGGSASFTLELSAPPCVTFCRLPARSMWMKQNQPLSCPWNPYLGLYFPSSSSMSR